MGVEKNMPVGSGAITSDIPTNPPVEKEILPDPDLSGAARQLNRLGGTAKQSGGANRFANDPKRLVLEGFEIKCRPQNVVIGAPYIACGEVDGVSVNFETKNGKEVLTAESKVELKKLVKFLNKDHPELKLRIEGHVADSSDLQKDIKSSVDRAKMVKDFLVKDGIDKNRLKAEGYGPMEPIDEDHTWKNNRIEFKILDAD